MNAMRRTNDRCDLIIALIDDCLAEYELDTLGVAVSPRSPAPAPTHVPPTPKL